MREAEEHFGLASTTAADDRLARGRTGAAVTVEQERTWIVPIEDPGSGGRLTHIAVRAPRANAAVRMVRGAGVHKRSIHAGAHVAGPDLPWPDDPTVVFLRRRLGWGEDERWRPVTEDRLL